MRVVHEELVHQADLPLLRVQPRDILPIHEDLARGNRVQPGHHLDQRGLARSRCAQQHIEVAGLQGQVCGLDMDDVADPFGRVLKFDHVRGFRSRSAMHRTGLGVGMPGTASPGTIVRWLTETASAAPVRHS